jgi:hypothetical protein
LQEINGSLTPSALSSSSGTATPTTPRESVSSTTSPSPLSQPVQTADHKQNYEFSMDPPFQSNMGKMPELDEEVSPRSISAQFRLKKTRSENEPLSMKEAKERPMDVVTGQGDVGHE